MGNLEEEIGARRPSKEELDRLILDLQEAGFDTTTSNDIGYAAEFLRVGESQEFGDEERGVRVTRTDNGFTIEQLYPLA